MGWRCRPEDSDVVNKTQRVRGLVIGVCLVGGALTLQSATGAAQAPAAGTPVFTKDIAPIFQDKCEACHRPDSIAPMSLVTYAETRPWARAIRARVADRQMPPWNIDKTVGVQKFKNDRSLTDEQIDTIVRWVDAGAPPGEPKDMPLPRTWPEDQGWNFAALFGQKEPDLIIKSYDFTMPAQSQDAWDKRVTPSGITEPRWVRAIEIRPSTVKGRKITHHAIAYLEQDDPASRWLWSSDSVHGVGRGEAGRVDATRHREAAAARIEVPLGHSLFAGRRRDYRPSGDGNLLLPEGTGAQIPDEPFPRSGGARDARHSSKYALARGRLYLLARGGAPRKLPAAHAPAR
jgi:hypothetical protein